MLWPNCSRGEVILVCAACAVTLEGRKESATTNERSLILCIENRGWERQEKTTAPVLPIASKILILSFFSARESSACLIRRWRRASRRYHPPGKHDDTADECVD